MKKTLSVILAVVLLMTCLSACASTAAPADAAANEYSVAICQLMVHPSLDEATQGFIDALTEAVEADGVP